jgi:mannose-1-phosphate guanylyltransferase/mannose-6-phosphate isomerase
MQGEAVTRIVPVIMSGGSGTRLWPLSRISHPKQLHALVSDMSMVQETVQRVSGSGSNFTFERPIIVLNALQHDLARAQLDALGVAPSHYVVEPVGRNTAPVAAVAAELVRRVVGDDALILLLPADHHIRDEKAFHDAIAEGASLADRGHVITFGIQPDGPETGYGYIRRGAELDGGFHVAEFTEKPDKARAEAFLETGEFYWNAGIFLFGARTLVQEMQAHCPDVLRSSIEALGDAGTKGDVVLLDAGAFGECPAISFDYAVMERTDRAAVVPADIGWSDVGAWSALWEIADKDADGNSVRGDVQLVDTRNTYALSTGQKLAVIGVEDLVVVATDDAVLVVRRDASQDVKTVVEVLKAENRTELL